MPQPLFTQKSARLTWARAKGGDEAPVRGLGSPPASLMGPAKASHKQLPLLLLLADTCAAFLSSH